MHEQRSVVARGHRVNRALGMMQAKPRRGDESPNTERTQMDWKEAIRQWRALPEEEKRRRRLESLPRKVARSCAFEGEPVDLALLEAELARLVAQGAQAGNEPDTRGHAASGASSP